MASFRSGLKIISDVSKTQGLSLLRNCSQDRSALSCKISTSPASITPTTSLWFEKTPEGVKITEIKNETNKYVSDAKNTLQFSPMGSVGKALTQQALDTSSRPNTTSHKTTMMSIASAKNPFITRVISTSANNPSRTESQMYYFLPSIRRFSSFRAVPNQHSLTSVRFYSDKKKDEEPKCVKVPSGIEGKGRKSDECKSILAPYCAPRVRANCNDMAQRQPCTKLEAPFPSFSECAEEIHLKFSECPNNEREKPERCIFPNHGKSYSGCDPPLPVVGKCAPKKRRGPNPYKNTICGGPTACDPTQGRFKNPSFSTYAAADSLLSPSNSFSTSTRSYSGKARDNEAEKCVKMPSSIGASKASSDKCPSFTTPKCKPRGRKDCMDMPTERAACVKLEAPFPSYSECAKDFPPDKIPTECHGERKLIPPHCIADNPGVSYSACDPPSPRVPPCPKDVKRGPIPWRNDPCPTPKTPPCPKPFKNPNDCKDFSTLSSPMFNKPESATLLKSILPSRSFADDKKCKEEKEKPCFASVKKEKKVNLADEESPVKCGGAKREQANRCQFNACNQTTDKPWKLCERPASLDVYKCPVKEVKIRTKPAKKVKKCKIAEVIKLCPPPRKADTYICSCLPPPKKVCAEEVKVEECYPTTPAEPCPCYCEPKNLLAKVVKVHVPTPTKCICPENCPVSEESKECRKMPGAKDPDCNKEGGKLFDCDDSKNRCSPKKSKPGKLKSKK